MTMRLLMAAVVGVGMMFQSWGFVLPHQNAADTLILVNKTNRAPAVPVVLEKPDVPPSRESVADNIYMRPEAADALEELFEAAEKEDIHLYATSGFRSYGTQKAIFERKLEKMDEKQANASVAKPGYSEHQTGLAMDIEGESTLGTGLREEFAKTPEGVWVAENCWRYGFIIRYPKGKSHITGYVYEPWHIRYVGCEAAKAIYDADITFEEYIAQIRKERIQWLEAEE